MIQPPLTVNVGKETEVLVDLPPVLPPITPEPRYVIAHSHGPSRWPDGPKSPKLPLHNPDLDPAEYRASGDRG